MLSEACLALNTGFCRKSEVNRYQRKEISTRLTGITRTPRITVTPRITDVEDDGRWGWRTSRITGTPRVTDVENDGRWGWRTSRITGAPRMTDAEDDGRRRTTVQSTGIRIIMSELLKDTESRNQRHTPNNVNCDVVLILPLYFLSSTSSLLLLPF